MHDDSSARPADAHPPTPPSEPHAAPPVERAAVPTDVAPIPDAQVPETTEASVEPLEVPAATEPSLALEPAPIAEPPPLPPPPPPPPPEYPFEFHGSAREYFRIWIVNTLLTLLTLGVFAAWAKVRKRRYLRGNTSLMGNRFDYLADPRRLLIGNLFVAAAFLAYAVVGEVYPWVKFAAFAVGVIALPWVIVRSLAFNAHNTTYRGMRFTYRQTYGMAAMTYLGQGLAVIFTAGIFYPAWMRNRREFTVGSHRLGDAFFRFTGTHGQFYVAYLLGGLILAGAAVVGSMLTGLLVVAHGSKVPSLTELAPFFLLYGAAFFVAKHLIYGLLFNHIWNHTQLDEHRFVANFNTHRWLNLQLQNLFAIIGTLGLAYPWAVVRSTRYAASCLRFRPAGSVEKIARFGSAKGSAVGDTATEFIGLDFGL